MEQNKMHATCGENTISAKCGTKQKKCTAWDRTKGRATGAGQLGFKWLNIATGLIWCHMQLTIRLTFYI